MDDTLARAAYEAFNTHRRGTRKLPPWDLALDMDKAAWREVARAVLEAAPMPVFNHAATCPEGVRDCNCLAVPLRRRA